MLNEGKLEIKAHSVGFPLYKNFQMAETLLYVFMLTS
jgi:hypothetical protein